MREDLSRRDLLVGMVGAMGLRAMSPVFAAVTAFSNSSMSFAAGTSALNDKQRQMIDILAEMIIPETDTPGAREAGVPAFIDQMVSNWYRKNDQLNFIFGLRALDHHCRISFGSPFLDCSDEQQIVALEDMEQNVSGTMSDGEIGGISDRVAATSGDFALWNDIPLDGREFFDQIKSLTVLGYYTSEIGIEHELIYDPQPGSYDGSADFATLGKHYTS